jgi:hypothetical protein
LKKKNSLFFNAKLHTKPGFPANPGFFLAPAAAAVSNTKRFFVLFDLR